MTGGRFVRQHLSGSRARGYRLPVVFLKPNCETPATVGPVMFCALLAHHQAGASALLETLNMYFTEHAKRAALEIVEACRNPPSLIDHLARLVSRKQRPGVVSDTWSYRNQLIVLLRGHSEARGFKPWAEVGRKVQKGQKAFYIMAPVLVNKKDDQKSGAKAVKPKKAGGKKDKEQEKALIGYRAVPVFGLEQTEPAEDWKEEERYHPFGEGKGTVRVFKGYRQPWYRWYEKLLPETLDELTALLGAAIVAKLFNQPTELQDLLNKLGTHPVEDVAERIDKSCRAVGDYLAEEGILADEVRQQQ